MADIPVTRYVKTADGVHIAYQTWGSGPPDVLWCGALWWHVEFQWTDPETARGLRRLSQFGRIISFDKRGTGLSDRVPVDRLPTLEERIQDLTAVLDAVGCDDVVLFGVNHGGPMAMLFAATFPERTRALVLIGSFARLLRTDDHPWGLTAELAARAEERMENHWDEPHALRQVAPSRSDDPGLASWWASMQRMAASPSAAVALWRMALATDVRAVLPAIRVPTLVLHQTGDRLIDIGCGRYVAEHIPGATFIELPGDDVLSWSPTEGFDEVHEFVTGERVPRVFDRVLATVVFTDLVDSTVHAAAMGDQRWRELLDRHDSVVARALERHGGRKVNPTGDGVLAMFDGPARAVHFATAVRDGVAALGLAARAGVHTGEIELRDDDIGGIAVHIAARVAATAKSGEVLVSRTVTDLVAGSGIEFSDRGDHDLKGVPGTWRLFAVDG